MSHGYRHRLRRTASPDAALKFEPPRTCEDAQGIDSVSGAEPGSITNCAVGPKASGPHHFSGE